MDAFGTGGNPEQRSARGRWRGPGLGLLLLAGAGTYAAFCWWGPPPGTPSSAPARVDAPPVPGTPSAPVASSRAAPSGGAPSTLARPAPGQPSAPTAGPAAAEAMTEAQHREAVRQAAHAFRVGRFDAFFREDTLFKEFAQAGPARLAALKAELADPGALASLPGGTQFLEGKPDAVLERMSMIDILHSLAAKDPGARDTMVELALAPIDTGLSDVAKKGLVGEKYDLLFRLAQLDPHLAVDTYGRLDNPKLMSLLRDALIAGLSESGAPQDEVRRLTQRL